MITGTQCREHISILSRNVCEHISVSQDSHASLSGGHVVTVFPRSSAAFSSAVCLQITLAFRPPWRLHLLMVRKSLASYLRRFASSMNNSLTTIEAGRRWASNSLGTKGDATLAS
jgi:hypothetical protein